MSANLISLAGKTVERAIYNDPEIILLAFTDGASLRVREVGHAGQFRVTLNGNDLPIPYDDDDDQVPLNLFGGR